MALVELFQKSRFLFFREASMMMRETDGTGCPPVTLKRTQAVRPPSLSFSLILSRRSLFSRAFHASADGCTFPSLVGCAQFVAEFSPTRLNRKQAYLPPLL